MWESGGGKCYGQDQSGVRKRDGEGSIVLFQLEGGGRGGAGGAERGGLRRRGTERALEGGTGRIPPVSAALNLHHSCAVHHTSYLC